MSLPAGEAAAANVPKSRNHKGIDFIRPSC
jgi:hypothetical protein